MYDLQFQECFITLTVFFLQTAIKITDLSELFSGPQFML